MNLTYADSGVDIEAGDKASRAAYLNAKSTFASREGMMGAAVNLEGGFAGVLDFGDFYLVQNDDGTGSKSEIAEKAGIYDGIGIDLCCMVADDAICIGAEVVSITNTFDVPFIEPEKIEGMTASLAKACREQKIVIPGGEIAEVPGSVKSMVWNATAVGIVKKDKYISGKTIAAGQKIIGLKDPMIRSNGFSLVRKALETHVGEDYVNQEWKDGKTWGEVLLTPSKIFHRLVVETVIGGFEDKRPFEVHGICHVTGGGIVGNVPRILPEGLGADFANLHSPHEALIDIQKMANITDEEAYRTWHGGTALMIIVDESIAGAVCEALNEKDPSVEAQVVGKVTDDGVIKIQSKFGNGGKIEKERE